MSFPPCSGGCSAGRNDGLNGFPSSLSGRKLSRRSWRQEQARTVSPPPTGSPTPLAGNLGSGGAGSTPQTSGLSWDQKLASPVEKQWAWTPPKSKACHPEGLTWPLATQHPKGTEVAAAGGPMVQWGAGQDCGSHAQGNSSGSWATGQSCSPHHSCPPSTHSHTSAFWADAEVSVTSGKSEQVFLAVTQALKEASTLLPPAWPSGMEQQEAQPLPRAGHLATYSVLELRVPPGAFLETLPIYSTPVSSSTARLILPTRIPTPRGETWSRCCFDDSGGQGLPGRAFVFNPWC
ncbi:uncharacterized protein LOC128575463 [Nycticebus coucang]|uniref:uncharacterized protein LOC128575463 n=1 Tax=Nycticebus coucang TaxID=9470 RepID=UPI00234D4D3E|nr:uncharacterized protein LOC128575463 [Nycticebus coucang]